MLFKDRFRGWEGPPGPGEAEGAAFWFARKGHGPFGHGGPFGGDPFDEDGGRRHRRRRGDIKLALLELLGEQPRHGYDLIKELERRYAGFYRPSPGSVYPTLQLLEEEGHVTSEQVEGKRVYTITEAGRQLLEEQRRQRGPHGPDHWEAHGYAERAELGELRRHSMALIESLMQVARHGNPAQVRTAIELLESTRRAIYRLLAQEETGE